MSDSIIILPVKNEVAALDVILPKIAQTNIEIIVIDGNSLDGSLKLLKNYNINYIKQKRKGKGNAIREAFDYLIEQAYDFVVMIDADNTCSINDVIYGLKTLKKNENIDFLIGNRFFYGRPLTMGYINYLVNKLVSKIISIRTGIKINDVQSPFWIWRENTVKKINKSLIATKFELEVDIFLQCISSNLKFIEIPMHYNTRIGKSKFSFFLKFRNLIIIPYLLIKKRSLPH